MVKSRNLKFKLLKTSPEEAVVLLYERDYYSTHAFERPPPGYGRTAPHSLSVGMFFARSSSRGIIKMNARRSGETRADAAGRGEIANK